MYEMKRTWQSKMPHVSMIQRQEINFPKRQWKPTPLSIAEWESPQTQSLETRIRRIRETFRPRVWEVGKEAAEEKHAHSWSKD